MGSFDYLFKVLVVGDSTVGKTSLLNRYVHDVFGKEYKMTMGVDFALKVVQWSDTEMVRLQLWDIAGQERFTSMTRLYYKQASGCIIMFDLTGADSFRSCQMWKSDLDSKVTLSNGDPVPCILLANKEFFLLDLYSAESSSSGFSLEDLGHIAGCDLSPWAVTKEQIDKFSKENNFIGWTETSVKENKNINESMRVLIERMMELRESGRSSAPLQGDYININDISVPGSGCC